jgi:Ser/Thr protein kinase RdoA (MazF antagonist)
VIARNNVQLTAQDRSTLARFSATLPKRFTDIAACGLPDTLVHGDFHPGNLRGNETQLTLLDWGDCCVGNPLLDQPAFLERVPSASLKTMRQRWNDAWKTVSPGSDPARASTLLAPIAAARRAVIYQEFLDRIEPSEHPYHRADPLDQLQRTATLVRTETHD